MTTLPRNHKLQPRASPAMLIFNQLGITYLEVYVYMVHPQIAWDGQHLDVFSCLKMKLLQHEVPQVDTFTPRGYGNIIQKTVGIGVCQEEVCHEGEVADLMALKSAGDVNNLSGKILMVGMYQLKKSQKIDSVNALMKHKCNFKIVT